MTPPDQDLSLLTVSVLALSAVLGPQLAMAFAAYSIIMLGWLGGVMVGVYRMPPTSRVRSQVAGFVAVTLVATLGVTVPLAGALADGLHAVAPWAYSTQANGLLFPVAFAVPAIGHTWLDVAKWAWGFFQRRIGGIQRDQDGGRKP